jgi:hypothetical protein
MNDSSVSVVSLKTVLACQAYILFYSKYCPPAPVPVPVPAQAPTPTAVTAPIAGLAAAPVASAASAASSTVVDGVNKLTPAVLIRTPASGANNNNSSNNNILASITATEVASSAANSKTDAVLDPAVVQKSKATINALFAAAGDVSDSEDTSSKPATSISDDAEIGSRLPERAHAFKFYGPLRYVLSELLLKV